MNNRVQKIGKETTGLHKGSPTDTDDTEHTQFLNYVCSVIYRRTCCVRDHHFRRCKSTLSREWPLCLLSLLVAKQWHPLLLSCFLKVVGYLVVNICIFVSVLLIYNMWACSCVSCVWCGSSVGVWTCDCLDWRACVCVCARLSIESISLI